MRAPIIALRGGPIAVAGLIAVLAAPGVSFASKSDRDNDGLSNRTEARKHCNPRKKDTDRDGMPDRYEVLNKFNCAKKSDAAKDAGGKAKVATFDMNKDLVTAIKDGRIQFAVDQQPYLQGYEAVDELWLYKNNGDIIGGGQPVLTGPAIVEQLDCTTVIEPGNRVEVDPIGNLIVSV